MSSKVFRSSRRLARREKASRLVRNARTPHVEHDELAAQSSQLFPLQCRLSVSYIVSRMSNQVDPLHPVPDRPVTCGFVCCFIERLAIVIRQMQKENNRRFLILSMGHAYELPV